ncbi:DUF3429 domain-containing protein [Sphingomonas montana]|uniref:DUF3429 domain-containing protein n=1 Tax=Sphingomonas montana TaxID=1843236 RepID=UPI0009F8A2D8|nr:DUF3429 domain-containing protein [Sphingomonas montana]
MTSEDDDARGDAAAPPTVHAVAEADADGWRVGGAEPVRLAIGLGLAGLLPQGAAILSPLLGMDWLNGQALALVYGALILSFLGGSWWGIALTRAEGRRRSILLLLGIGASLMGFCVQGLAGASPMRALLIVLGCAIAGSWLVDRMLVAEGMIGRWWGWLRLVLSLGLGGLTVLAGVLAG